MTCPSQLIHTTRANHLHSSTVECLLLQIMKKSVTYASEQFSPRQSGARTACQSAGQVLQTISDAPTLTCISRRRAVTPQNNNQAWFDSCEQLRKNSPGQRSSGGMEFCWLTHREHMLIFSFAETFYCLYVVCFKTRFLTVHLSDAALLSHIFIYSYIYIR